MSRSPWKLLLAVVLMGAVPTMVYSADDKPAEESKTEKPAEEGDLYDVPTTTDSDVLYKFLIRLRDYTPGDAQEALLHRKKAGDAAFLAAGHIVSFNKDKSSEAYRYAYPIVVNRKLSGLYLKSKEEQQKVNDEVMAYLADSKELGLTEVRLMMSLSRALESAENAELAEAAYAKFGKQLAEADDERFRDLGKKFLGSVTRMKLVGQPIEIAGTRLDGEKFKIESLKGKTVLIDFWATWCGPCRETIPQLREHYAAYKDKGFEIVGISVDEDRGELDEFMNEEKLPWIILNEEEGKNEASEKYGIIGIPAMFLVGPDGKVISTGARGEELTKLLTERFGGEKKTEGKKD